MEYCMKNISENIRKLGYEHKVLWKDGEDIIETWTESKRIDVGLLRSEIARLQEQTDNMPLTMELPTGKEQMLLALEEKKNYLKSLED